METKTDIWLVIDVTGKAFLGEVVDFDKDSPNMSIKNPALFSEQLSQDGQKIDFVFSPILRTSEIPQIEMRWGLRTPAPDRLVYAYKEYTDHMRAQKIGIVASSDVSQAVDIATKQQALKN